MIQKQPHYNVSIVSKYFLPFHSRYFLIVISSAWLQQSLLFVATSFAFAWASFIALPWGEGRSPKRFGCHRRERRERSDPSRPPRLSMLTTVGFLQDLTAHHGAIQGGSDDGSLALDLSGGAAQLIGWMGAAAVDKARALHRALCFGVAAAATAPSVIHLTKCRKIPTYIYL